MPTVLILGAGLMGPAIARDLLAYAVADRVVLADKDPSRVEQAVTSLGAGTRPHAVASAPSRLEGKVLDLWDRRSLVAAMGEADVVAGAYPVAAVRQVTEAALEAGVPLADLTGSADGFDIFGYHDRATAGGVTLLPGCGVAPGLSNALAGQGAARLDGPLEGIIYVGGLPLHPVPPFNYRVVFSLETVIDEYVAPALIVRDGRMAEVPALDGLEEVVFPEPVGRCEAFYTYGLGTLARTGAGLGFLTLAEKTVRYPGHRDQVLLLRQCGFLARQPVWVDGAEVTPRRFTAALLEPLLRQGDPADVTVLRVVVAGRRVARRAANRVAWEFEMVDAYDPATGVTSMARTTGYTCSILIGMLLSGRVETRGVVPLESIFGDPRLYQELRRELDRRGVHLHERLVES